MPISSIQIANVNPFVPNAPFQGVEKGCIGNKWIKETTIPIGKL